MMKIPLVVLITFLLIGLAPVSGLNVVTTTTVLYDPVHQIGGDNVSVIYIAEPSMMHLDTEKIPAQIQKFSKEIETADLFLAHNSTMDSAAMQAVEKFRDSNGFGKTNWQLLKPGVEWNTPETAGALADTVLDWLKKADPKNATAFTESAEKYKEDIAKAGGLTDEEKSILAKKYAIAMAWQKTPVEKWLGMNVVDVFAPEFALGGNKTPAKVVDALKADPKKLYALDILPGGGKIFVIENMQSGEMAKGIEEALTDLAIKSKRVVFTNFPKSVEGVDTIPDVLKYNKELVLQ